MSGDTPQEQGCCGHERRLAAVEALLFSLDRPVPAAKLAETIRGVLGNEIAPGDVDDSVSQLNAVYDDTGRAFRIERVAGGIRVMTRPEHASLLAAFHRARSSAKLSKPAIETLAVIAYRQPITRAQLEAIRGVGCGEVLKTLIEKRLIAVAGRSEELGRPMLYATTKHFLDVFGLASIKDLPPAGTGVPSFGAKTAPEGTREESATEQDTVTDTEAPLAGGAAGEPAETGTRTEP